MTTEQENLILEMLRRLDAKMDRVIDDIADLKRRVTALEEGQAALAQGLAGVNRRLDRLEALVDRIERRLDLAGSPAQRPSLAVRGWPKLPPKSYGGRLRR